MKFYARTKLIIIFFSLLFLPSVSKPFTSKQYQITRVFINAQLLPDGSMEVDEFRTYKFTCLLYTSPSPRDLSTSRMPSSA